MMFAHDVKALSAALTAVLLATGLQQAHSVQPDSPHGLSQQFAEPHPRPHWPEQYQVGSSLSNGVCTLPAPSCLTIEPYPGYATCKAASLS